MKREMEHVFAALTPANRLVCRVAAHTGLRVGDVLAIPTAKLGTQFWLTEQKTGKRRRVNLPKALVDEIKAQAGPEWAFPGARDSAKHRTRQTVWADVKRCTLAEEKICRGAVGTLQGQLCEGTADFEPCRHGHNADLCDELPALPGEVWREGSGEMKLSGG